MNITTEIRVVTGKMPVFVMLILKTAKFIAIVIFQGIVFNVGFPVITTIVTDGNAHITAAMLNNQIKR